MSWLESIFYRGKTRQERQVEAIRDDVRKEAEKEGISDPLFGVSEPIISFVETVRNNPKRFRIKEDVYISSGEVYGKLLLDKYTKESWNFIEEVVVEYVRLTTNSSGVQSKSILHFEPGKMSWVTYKEREYLIKEITSILTAEYKRKRERVQNIQRKHYMKIYCKGD
jgi:hypothetical protein